MSIYKTITYKIEKHCWWTLSLTFGFVVSVVGNSDVDL